ncbi:uncharacterized protein LOC117703448 isoform X1 [Arvicanthis niloticus]|uniref:uncharacterized protein LOC117703448 isoform X1 n=1 Tax=Arvicanthis niloticus TaxID=61156 RepID=UPI00402B9142
MWKKPYTLESDVNHPGKTNSRTHASKKTVFSIVIYHVDVSAVFLQTPTLKPRHWESLEDSREEWPKELTFTEACGPTRMIINVNQVKRPRCSPQHSISSTLSRVTERDVLLCASFQ